MQAHLYCKDFNWCIIGFVAISKHDVFPLSVFCIVCRQQGRECRGAAGELPVGSRALQQTDQTGCQQEPAGHHLHTGVSVSAHQRGKYTKAMVIIPALLIIIT